MDRRYFIKSLGALVITTSAGDTFSGMPDKAAEKITTNDTGPHGVVRKITFAHDAGHIRLCAYDGEQQLSINSDPANTTFCLAMLLADAAKSGMGPLVALPPMEHGGTTEYIMV